MIVLLNILIAYLLRRRYVADDDPWLAIVAFYGSCAVYTPLFGIPFFKLICGKMNNFPWGRIYEADGTFA